MSRICPFGNDHCHGIACANFNEPTARWGKPDKPRGCMGENPTTAWSHWYLTELQALKERTLKAKETTHHAN